MNQKNQVEIERKFIVKKLPQNLDKYSSEDIEQKYLTSPENEVEIRLRRKGDKYFQTTKKGNGKSRLETETEISENKFKQLEVSALGRKIEKKRYSIPYGSETIELDIYKGDLTGLTVAEVEFKSEKASNDFIVPDWFDKEVTYDENYKNHNLVLRGEIKIP